MKKTLLVTIDFWPKVGGVANYYFNLCKHLDKCVVLTDGGRDDGSSGLKIYRKKLLWRYVWPHWIPMFFYIWRVVHKEKIKKIWVGEVLPTGTPIYMLAKLLKLPYVVSCHGMDLLQAQKNPRKRKLAEKVLRTAEYVTANSKNTADIVKNFGVSEDKIKVIYPGVDIEILKKLNAKENKPELELENKRILFSVGRLVERKGFDNVIRAMEKVGNDIFFIIAGDGPERERLEKLAEGKNVKFTGQVSDEEKWAWLRACDVFITTARDAKDDVEGFGIVYLEAALAGKPVIAGNVGGAKEAVVDGETGLLVDPENIDEIEVAIEKLFKDYGLRALLGRNGKERAEKEFGWGTIANVFKEVL